MADVLFFVNGAGPYGRFAASSNGFPSGGSGVGVTCISSPLYNLNYGSNYAIHANEEKIYGDTQDDTQGDTQDDTQEKIIKMIKENPQVSTADMCQGIKNWNCNSKTKNQKNV